MKLTKKTLGLVAISVVALLLLGSSVMGNARKPISAYGALTEGLLTAYGSSSHGPNYYSGREWVGYGKIESIGHATVEISAAWDWYGDWTTDHPGALVVINPVDHLDTKAETSHEGPFVCEATVTIIDDDGDQINSEITCGSVYELETFGYHESVNEWLISFKIISGTGRYSDAAGTGIYRMVWESGPGSVIPFTGVYVDPARFLLQEIFLTYTP